MNPIGPDDVTDARAAVKALRAKLEEAYSAEYAATAARHLAQRALTEATDRLYAIEKAAGQ